MEVSFMSLLPISKQTKKDVKVFWQRYGWINKYALAWGMLYAEIQRTFPKDAT